MTTTDRFTTFLNNIRLTNDSVLSNRYKEITKKLNKRFRDSESETNNCLQVGSYGRHSGIKGISDLDMLYIMPDSLWDEYKSDPDKLLRHTKEALKERYPKTDITYDTLVVVLNFKDYKFEVQPVFATTEEGDDLVSYKYPYTKNGGCYRITKPRHEQNEMKSFNDEHGDTHRRVCKMMRAWTNNAGLQMGGLLLDTLAYNFMKDDDDVAETSISSFDTLCRDFFEFLKDEPKQDHYQALGSNQDVKVKHPFQSKAKEAYDMAIEAIDAENEEDCHNKWRDIFGRNFPKAPSEENLSNKSYSDREEFIEDRFPIDIQGRVRIDCNISANGYRDKNLREFLRLGRRIMRIRSLDFFISTCDIEKPYIVKWKVRNVGAEAKRRNCLRGQIEASNRNNNVRHESADFIGPHYVECYIIKNDYVVAKDRISVPII